MLDEIKCQKCNGTMNKTEKIEKNLLHQLFGILIFIIGLLLCFLFPIGTLFGLVLMYGALYLGYSKKKVWKCSNCGYYFEYTD